MADTVLHIDTSARNEGSQSRALTEALVRQLAPNKVIRRDLGANPPTFVDEAWVTANFTPEDQRSPAQIATLKASDALVQELFDADTIVIGLPIYNFAPPAAFKAWIDKVARARTTFRYTPEGPVGLLEGKRAYVVVASGGTPVDAPIDFATPYVRHVLGFVGITDVETIAADRLMSSDDALIAARAQILALG